MKRRLYIGLGSPFKVTVIGKSRQGGDVDLKSHFVGQTGFFPDELIIEGNFTFDLRTNEALLGLATTQELLDELQARAKINGYAQYRTIDQ